MAIDVELMFFSFYPVGSRVILIDTDDTIIRGKITKLTPEGVEISRLWHKSLKMAWKDIRFVSDDGYPVREVKIPWRENLGKDLAELRGALVTQDADGVAVGRLSASRIAFGDPFELEAAELSAVNVGNDGRYFFADWREEAILCTSRDGARAILWDFTSIFEWSIPAALSR